MGTVLESPIPREEFAAIASSYGGGEGMKEYGENAEEDGHAASVYDPILLVRLHVKEIVHSDVALRLHNGKTVFVLRVCPL